MSKWKKPLLWALLLCFGMADSWALTLQIPTRATTLPLAIPTISQLASGQNNPKSVSAWGDNSYGQRTIPVGLTNVVQVSTGMINTVALKSDGTVVAWGDNQYGQCSIPVGLTNVVQVAAGDWHTVALKSDGTVVAWGSDGSGQCTIPAGLTNVVQVSAGYDHAVVLKSDGTIVAWGSNGDAAYRIPVGLTNVVQVAAGGYYTVALKADGTVVAWGANQYGQCSIPGGLTNVVQVAAGGYYTVALKSNGTVVAWGDNGSRQCTIPAGLTNAVQVSAGWNHTVALGFFNTLSSFPTISDHTYGDVPFIVQSPTASSGLPVTLSVFSGPATISSNVVTITGVGTVILAANQEGNSNYLPASQVTASFVVSPYQQTLTAFPTIPNHVYGDTPFSITLPTSSSPSGYPVVYGVSGPATLSSNVVTITGAGIVALTANQAGNSNYTAASQVSTNFTVSQGSQTITFPAIGSLALTTNRLTLLGAASSGLPVSYSVISGPAQLVGSNQLSFTGAGSVTIQANQAGDSNWLAASSVTQSFNVRQGSQTISFAPLGSNGYGTVPYLLTNASASSGLPVTYTSSAPKVAAIVSNTLTVMGLGTTTITASQGGDSNWFAATPVNQNLVVGKGSQSITAFTTVPNPTYASNAIVTLPLPLPTASSGLPVTLNVKSGPAVMSGTNAVRITGGGAVVLAADQAGNTNYLSASQVTTSFTVQKAPQTIGAFATIPGKTNGVAPFLVTIPTASSGLPVVLSVVSGPATASNSTVRITGAGAVTLAANQVGNSNYFAAQQVTTSFEVAKGSQTITWAAPATVINGAATVQLAAKASSGLPVTYTTYAGNIRVTTNGLVTILGSGTASITASQLGDVNWNPAISLSQNLVVALPAGSTNAASNQIAGISPVTSLPSLPVRPSSFPLTRPSPAGSVVAWGNSTYAQTNIPKGLTNIVQLSSRGLHSLALRTNGSVVAWGWNGYGQATVPASVTNAVQVAAGVSFSTALRTNGVVIAWGNNSLGQTNVPPGLTNTVQVAAGSHHALALRFDGSVLAWGWNGYGQTDVPAEATNVVQVAAGYFHSVALKADGSVEAWGDDTYGETDIPPGLTNVVRIAAGLNHTLALKSDGTVAAWGWDNMGQSDVPAGLTGVSQIAAGGNTSFAVTTNGTLITWGDNSYGQRKPPAGVTGIYQFVLGLYHALGLKR